MAIFRKKLGSVGVLYFLLVMVVVPFYPGRVRAEEPLSISGMAIETKSFRPYREEGKFSFFLNRASQITAEIQDTNFNLVRTIALMKSGESGKNTLEWDGKDEKGDFIEEGKYILSLSAMTDDGSSALISKEISFDFDAPEGAELENNITKIEGKEKKLYYSNENPPEKTVWGEFVELQWVSITKDAYHHEGKNNCCLAALVTVLCSPFTFIISFFKSTPAPERIEEENEKIKEYNTEIEAEIAEKNKEINEFNERVKDTVTITMEFVD